MADGAKEHVENLGLIAAGVATFIGGCGAMFHRRKLSDADMDRLREEVVAALRKESLASIGDLGDQMEAAVTLMKAGVARIEELVADVPSMKTRLAHHEGSLLSIQQDITEIRGELRRMRER